MWQTLSSRNRNVLSSRVFWEGRVPWEALIFPWYSFQVCFDHHPFPRQQQYQFDGRWCMVPAGLLRWWELHYNKKKDNCNSVASKKMALWIRQKLFYSLESRCEAEGNNNQTSLPSYCTECCCFIWGCLKSDPEQRLHLEEMLFHEWFKVLSLRQAKIILKIYWHLGGLFFGLVWCSDYHISFLTLPFSTSCSDHIVNPHKQHR